MAGLKFLSPNRPRPQPNRASTARVEDDGAQIRETTDCITESSSLRGSPCRLYRVLGWRSSPWTSRWCRVSDRRTPNGGSNITCRSFRKVTKTTASVLIPMHLPNQPIPPPVRDVLNDKRRTHVRQDINRKLCKRTHQRF